jgi:hypothetical protein
MFSMSRCILRWGLIGAAGLGTLAFVVGPDRLAAGVDQVRTTAQTIAEDFVEDPIALRRQLAGLAEKYPDRIAEVRMELAEIDRQVGKLEEDREIALRVVNMTTDDLAGIRVAVQDANIQAAGTRPVSIQVSGRFVDLDGARKEARRINSIRATYRDRQATDETQLELLTTQRQRLDEILVKLEDEHSRYQAKLWQLDRQIDSIARNERLIEMTKEQQAILADYDKFTEVGSLNQLEAKLSELRTIQEAQLQTLASRSGHDDYESDAREALQSDDWDDSIFDSLPSDGRLESQNAARDPLALLDR